MPAQRLNYKQAKPKICKVQIFFGIPKYWHLVVDRQHTTVLSQLSILTRINI